MTQYPGLTPEGVDEAQAFLDSLSDDIPTTDTAETEQRTPWRPSSLGQLVWLAEQRTAYAARIADIEAEAAARIAHIREWADSATKSDRRRLEWADGLLGEAALINREKTNQASLKLPTLTVRTTSTSPAVKVLDDAKAIEWARTHAPEAVKVTEKVLITSLKGVLTATDAGVVDTRTGEIVDAFDVTPAKITATIKPL